VLIEKMAVNGFGLRSEAENWKVNVDIVHYFPNYGNEWGWL
jgi:hypothetical protein